MKIEIYGYDQEENRKFIVMTVESLDEAVEYLRILRIYVPKKIFKWKLIEER